MGRLFVGGVVGGDGVEVAGCYFAGRLLGRGNIVGQGALRRLGGRGGDYGSRCGRGDGGRRSAELALLAAHAAGAENHADVHAVDEGGGAAARNERQGLAGYVAYIGGHEHIDHCLHHYQEGEPHGEEWGEGLVGEPPRDVAHPEEQQHIEPHHYHGAYEPKLFDDYGVDEVAISLWQRVALLGIAGALAQHIARGDGYARVAHLGVFVDVEVFGSNHLCFVFVKNAVFPRINAFAYHGHIFGELLGCGIADGIEQIYSAQARDEQHADGFADAHQRHAAHEHEQQGYYEEYGCRGEVVGQDERTDHGRRHKDELEGLGRGAAVGLVHCQHIGNVCYEHSLGYLGGLDGDVGAGDLEPACALVEGYAEAEQQQKEHHHRDYRPKGHEIGAEIVAGHVAHD